jgi:HlyD family type I secretion membrane fusion protein
VPTAPRADSVGQPGATGGTGGLTARFISSRWPILVGLFLLVVMFGGTLLWSAWAPLESAIPAAGVVAVESDRKVVQHLEGGIVRAILVDDGDRVSRGQALLELDDTRTRASYEIIHSQLMLALAVEARLLAERDDASRLLFPAELQTNSHPEAVSAMEGQRELFRARRDALLGETELLRQQISQFEQEIVGLEAQQDARLEQIRLLTGEVDDLHRLQAQGNVARHLVLAKERQLAELKGERGAYTADVAKARQGIIAAELQIQQLRKQRREEVETNLSETRRSVADLRQRLTAARDSLQRSTLRAPADGVIFALRVNNPGAVLQAGEEILYVVPEDDTLIIDARLRPTDVDEVSVGLLANVQFSGLSYRDTPTLEGEVIYLSADTQAPSQGQGQGQDPGAESFYRVQVRVPPEQLARLGEVRLQPGMPAQVLIKTGQRTLLDYLISPFSQMLDRAFIEQ